jgi:methylated-DNA-[protein]-cysteine S-methyltransferase
LLIPAGQTLTYGELSLKLQSSPRAIGQACKRNPIALFIPCHRVVGKKDLGGFMGDPEALLYKKLLLGHEEYLNGSNSSSKARAFFHRALPPSDKTIGIEPK